MPKRQRELNSLPSARQKIIFKQILENANSKYFMEALENDVPPIHFANFYYNLENNLTNKVEKGLISESEKKKKMKYARAVARLYLKEYNERLNEWARLAFEQCAAAEAVAKKKGKAPMTAKAKNKGKSPMTPRTEPKTRGRPPSTKPNEAGPSCPKSNKVNIVTSKMYKMNLENENELYNIMRKFKNM